MASLAETRDNETGNHVRRTQLFVRVLAEACRERGLFQPELDELLKAVVRRVQLPDIEFYVQNSDYLSLRGANLHKPTFSRLIQMTFTMMSPFLPQIS